MIVSSASSANQCLNSDQCDSQQVKESQADVEHLQQDKSVCSALFNGQIDLQAAQLRLNLEYKRQQFAKQEAQELIEEEMQRRKQEANTRIAAARKIIAQTTHSMILNEINSNSLQREFSQKLPLKSGSNLTFEQDYRISLLGSQGGVQGEALKSQSYEKNCLYQTLDLSRQQKQKYLFEIEEDNEIIEEVAKLNEKPHPMPLKPNTSGIIAAQSAIVTTAESSQGQNMPFQDQNQNQNKGNQINNCQNKRTGFLQHKKNSVSYSTSGSKPQSISKDALGNTCQTFRSPLKPPLASTSNKAISPKLKIFYRNNFNKDSKFVEKVQREQIKETVKQNLQMELNQLVESHDQTRDDDKVEDMILQLNRLNQKTNGIIPQEQQAKINSYVTELEQSKLTYSKTRASNSPNLTGLSNIQDTCSNKKPSNLLANSGAKTPNLNVNAEKLKEIIIQSESKVKQRFRMQRMSLQTNYNSANQSLDRGPYQQQESQNHSPKSMRQNQQSMISVQTLQQDMQLALTGINARVLAKFLKRRNEQVNQGDLHTAYLLALITALVDESIPLSNDKTDLQLKSWDEISRQLSNHGKIIYSLQKLRVHLVKEEFNRLLSKVQYLKKYEGYRGILDNSGFAMPINKFLDRIVSIFTQYKLIQQINDSESSRGFIENQKKQSTASQSYKKNIQLQSTNVQIPNYLNTPKTSGHPQSTRGSFHNLSSSVKGHKHLTIQGQLLQQKKMAVDKSYQLQLDQSKNIKLQEESAKKKQIEIAKLKIANSQYFAKINREDKIKHETETKKAELDYIQHQIEFRSRLNSVDRKQVEEEKLKLRETSLDNQEYKRNLRNIQKEEELNFYMTEAKQSLKELQFKQKLQQQHTQLKNVQIQQKHQEILLSKVKENEIYLINKETDLDERLKAQFDQAALKFKKLQEQEEILKQQRENLNKMSSRQGKR